MDKDTAVSHVNTTLAAGKRYSLYQSGFYNTTTKKVEAFIIEDNFAIPTSFAVASVRFVNAISNANPMALYARATTADSTVYPISGDVAYKSAGAWTSIPTGSYDLYTRYAGSTTNLILRTAVGFSGGHVYTVTARGDITSTATTRVPTLDNTANF